MTSEYETFNPPNTSAEADEAKEAVAQAQDRVPEPAVVKEALGQPEVMGAGAGGPYDEEIEPTSMRAFVAPAFRSGKFLVKGGEVVQVPSPRGPWAKERIGDVWVRFNNGVCRTDDPVVIAWCKAHPDICRDAFDAKTPAWVALTEATLETANRSARLPRNTDVEALLRGEMSGLGGSDLVRQARGE